MTQKTNSTYRKDTQTQEECFKMSVTVISKAAAINLVSVETLKYFKDYYDGKIRVGCGEDCAEQCEVDHGYYKPAKYENLFDTRKDK